ncbi:MAG TPA: alpha-1,4-glucan--maltose-1-phosphate maltosyltransferase, partial [Acidobacteriota bacterium]|nr:alpha-1,4-glucan--maltose-1-phosphate maltosyltransferase [Acidobacteriota bacterium]
MTGPTSKKTPSSLPVEDRKRVVIERVQPEIDSGRFPIKRVVGEQVLVEADVYADGHGALTAVLLFGEGENPSRWKSCEMTPLPNDRWQGSFTVSKPGYHAYTIEAWVNPFKSWRRDLDKKLQAGQDISVDLLVGAELVEHAASGAAEKDRKQIEEFAHFLKSRNKLEVRASLALDPDLAELIYRYPNKRFATRYDRQLLVWADRERARFTAWYEMFPRSCGENGKHGTFRDCERRIPDIAEMGFDVLYLPPIHPIGLTNRKGRNNAPMVQNGDCGSPWAIGSEAGGHKSIHPELGTLEDFQRLCGKASEHGLEIALDIAFQCSSDHPYAREHPEWFRRLPDGTIQFAENPPKKYEDIYPFEFESEEWPSLWRELKSVFDYWIEQGVRIFRVDNPHTKPFAFWEWTISEIRKAHPDVIFLSEAFTRPKVMNRLAKIGFTQSYTYFAWRNTKAELTEYFTELTQTEAKEYFRPNAWPNTPDILTEFLQTGGRPAFILRLILAATLSSNYGIYGPPFELCVSQPREVGSEEYLDSEKYEIRQWDLKHPNSLREIITLLNRIRRENPALQSNDGLRFHPVDNDQVICYSKSSPDRSNLIVVAANLNPHHAHSGWIHLPLAELGIPPDQSFQAHDLLSDARYIWHGPDNYVQLNPHVIPAHVFRIRR